VRAAGDSRGEVQKNPAAADGGDSLAMAKGRIKAPECLRRERPLIRTKKEKRAVEEYGSSQGVSSSRQ